MSSLDSWRGPLWWAHRGGGSSAPENTLAAFWHGAAFGFRAFECDVKLSADGVAFLMHDTTIERTTGRAGSVAESMGWSELSRLDAGSWHGPGYVGEPIPQLADVAAFCLQTGSTLNIEIKPTPGHDETTGAGVAEQAARLWSGRPRPPLLSSFSPRSLAAARQAAPQLPRALLLDRLGDDWLDQALRLDCQGLVMHHPLIDQTTASTLHEAGLFLMSYTVNELSVAEQLLAWGVDGLITDVMDRSSWPSAAQLR